MNDIVTPFRVADPEKTNESPFWIHTNPVDPSGAETAG
jgi:hypothetical protein